MSAPIVHHQQNRCMRRFHDAGAVSPQTAADLDRVGVRNSLVFRYLASRGVFVDGGDGRFYMDLRAEAGFRHRRFVLTCLVLAIGLALLSVLIVVAISYL